MIDPKAPPVSREDAVRFLARGIEMMQSDETRERLMDKDAFPRPGLALIEWQLEGWDELGVDRDLACQCMNQVEEVFPGDTELLDQLNDFARCSQRAYLQALGDRKPKDLDAHGPMERAVLLEFFDACNTKMSLPEFQSMLVKNLVQKQQPPNRTVIETQRELLEVLGYEKDHGCALLARIQQDFPNDAELHQKFRQWMMTAQMTCQAVMREAPCQAMMGEEETAERKRVMLRAQEDLQTMTQDDRQAFVERMKKKMKILATLPQEEQIKYMKSLSEADMLDFAKAQLLTTAQQQNTERGTCDGATSPAAMGGAHGRAQPSTILPPKQQSM